MSEKISIVIPTFNAAEFLPACLSTIIRQEYANCEVIIVDGGSRDGTADVVKRYSDLVSVFIQEPDKGQADAVTKGIRRATGSIIHWHAADDVLMPGALRRVSEEFGATSTLDLLFSDGWAFDTHHLYSNQISRWVNFWDALVFFGRFQSDCAYWRSNISHHGLPLANDRPLMCDEDFFLRLWAHGEARWIEERLGGFRLRKDQLSATLDRSKLEYDRRRTRQALIQQLNLTPAQIFTLRVKRVLPYAVRSALLPTITQLARRTLRVATNDKSRKSLERHFFAEWMVPIK